MRAEDAAYTMSLLPPDSPYFEIPEADHHVMIDQPLALVAGLAGLLAKLAAVELKGRYASLPAESRRLDRQMRLVLEARVLAGNEQVRGARHRVADRLDPGHFGLGEVAEHEVKDERLVAGVADAEAHALVVVADMRGDRAQAVVAGGAALRPSP